MTRCNCDFITEDDDMVRTTRRITKRDCEVHGREVKECSCYYEVGEDAVRHDFSENCAVHGDPKK